MINLLALTNEATINPAVGMTLCIIMLLVMILMAAHVIKFMIEDKEEWLPCTAFLLLILSIIIFIIYIMSGGSLT